MLSPSVLNSTLVPRWLRICLVVRLIMPSRLPDCWYFTLPDAVILKRFLAPDLVFSLGILLSSSTRRGTECPHGLDVLARHKAWSGCSGLSLYRCHGSPYEPGSEGRRYGRGGPGLQPCAGGGVNDRSHFCAANGAEVAPIL